jgi:Tfp pilus assembly protein PilO
MKKTTYLTVWACLGAMIILTAGICFWQFKANQASRALYKQKQAEYDDALAASKRLETLERQSQELKQKEIAVFRKVPVGDTTPLALIKKLTQIAGQRGLRNLSFDVPQPKDIQALAAQQDPYPMAFTMKFEGTFASSMDFLKALTALERLVNIEKIEIKRDENVLPYQQVSLRLVAYSFVKQQ